MDHDARVYDSIFEMLPCEENPSPLVRIGRMNPSERFVLYAKLEWMNPFGSVKDRAAWQMLQDLKQRGEMGDGRGVVEPTSSNTGISLAAMACALGHHMRAVVPNRIPLEKKLLLKICGAELDVVSDTLCPTPGRARDRSTWPRPTPGRSRTATSCRTSTRTSRTYGPTS
ncbi:MAG: pyridoxal-phosphate dependent enzyme [Planctomycetota bacterium]|jgi:cysteine synthase